MQGGKFEKTSPKWANFHKNKPNMPLAINWNNKSAIKFETKAIGKTNLQKTSSKNKQFQLKQAQKQATRKSSGKPATPQKNKPKFAGKPQGW